jgi:methylenetetrahydrofolate reductase (NADPH)
VRGAGIDAAIRLGIPGPASAGTLMRFAARCGVGASTSVLRKYGLSLTRLMQSAGPDAYVEALARRLDDARLGDVGLHFYPFGGLEKTATWIAAAQSRAR